MRIPVIVPEGAKLLIKKGQNVDFDTPFIQRNTEDEIKLPVAAALGIPPDKIFMYLFKFVGDTVQIDEVIAEKKAMMSARQYLSEYNGVVKEINHTDGTVRISTATNDSVEERCFFKGEVEEIEGNIVTVQVGKGKQYPLHEPTHYFGGQVLIQENVQATHITEDEVNYKVVVGDKMPSYDQMKFEALGAVGFVLLQVPDDTASIPVAILKEIADYEEIKKNKFSCCNIGPDHTTIYFYE